MRDIIITLMVFATLPFILRRTYLGVLAWSWLSYMTPHKQAWGFATSMPFAQIVAITTLVSLLFSKEKLKLPINGTILLWLAFLAWMGVTTIFAVFPEFAWDQYLKICKIQLVTFLTLVLINDFRKLNQLIWVIVISIGFYSAKGGLFTVLTGGSYRVWGPAGTFIAENNALAIATLMIIPLMIYLYATNKDRLWVKNGLLVMSVLSAFSVVGSQSRGALIAIAAVVIFFWLKSKTKLLSGLVLLLLCFAIFSFMPESWYARMDTIQNYEEDRSAMGRINAWQYSINVASARLTGAGMESWSTSTFAIWAPNPTDVHAAHSIYFSILADHGWPGLILYVLILGLTWRRLSKVIKLTINNKDLYAENLLARMVQVSLIAYMSGGAFLSLSYFDLPWHLFAVAIILQNHLTRKTSTSQAEVVERPLVYSK